MSEVRGGGNGSLLRRSRIACVVLLLFLLLLGMFWHVPIDDHGIRAKGDGLRVKARPG